MAGPTNRTRNEIRNGEMNRYGANVSAQRILPFQRFAVAAPRPETAIASSVLMDRSFPPMALVCTPASIYSWCSELLPCARWKQPLIGPEAYGVVVQDAVGFRGGIACRALFLIRIAYLGFHVTLSPRESSIDIDRTADVFLKPLIHDVQAL